MARLIDAKALERQVKETFKDSNPVLMGQMLRWIRIQQTIDAVPLVRCKDCKHYDKNALWCNINSVQFSETHYNWYEEDFCSYGERKDDEQTD